MGKSFWISGVVMSVASMAVGFVIHGVLLRGDYEGLVGTVLRSEEDSQRYFQWMLVANVLIGFAMTWIYRQGVTTAAAIGQGLRFGAAIALVSTIPLYLIYYVVEPLPASLVQKQIAFDIVGKLLMGVLVAFLNQRGEAR